MLAGETSLLALSSGGTFRSRSRRVRASSSRRYAVCAAQTEAEGAELVPLVRVGFSVRVRVAFGDTLLVVGSSPGLGEWDIANALELRWSQDADGADLWTGTAALPEHWVLRYKVRRSGTGLCRRWALRAGVVGTSSAPHSSHSHPPQFVVLRADGRVQWQPGDDLSSVASAAAASLSSESKLDIFRLNASLPFGERFALCGSAPGLGSWDAAQAVSLQWGAENVWQSSVSLPHDAPMEYKLLIVSAVGDARWVEGHNVVVLGLLGEEASRAHAHASNCLPISRNLHHQVEGYEQPFYWAAELGNADALVYLPDSAPLASAGLSSDERRDGARSAAELARVRSQPMNGLSALTEVAGAAGAEGDNVLRAAATSMLGGFASPEALQKMATAATAAGATAVAATAAVGGVTGVEGAIVAAALPMAEVTALGLLVAFGAKNLLHAEDRQRFLDTTGSRRKLMRLLRKNMMAVGVGGNAEVAAAVSRSAAEAGFLFDPLELFEDEDEAAEREENEAAAAAAAAAAEAAEIAIEESN